MPVGTGARGVGAEVGAAPPTVGLSHVPLGSCLCGQCPGPLHTSPWVKALGALAWLLCMVPWSLPPRPRRVGPLLWPSHSGAAGGPAPGSQQALLQPLGAWVWMPCPSGGSELCLTYADEGGAVQLPPPASFPLHWPVPSLSGLAMGRGLGLALRGWF